MSSERMMREVEAVLPIVGPGLTKREVHRALDCWAPITVHQALKALRAAGRAVLIGPPVGRRYLRSPNPPPP